MSDSIPRAEVERVLEELHKAKEDAVADQCFSRAKGIQQATAEFAALLKPKQYAAEWWIGIDKQGSQHYFGRQPEGNWQLVSLKHYTDTLEHGEGIES